MVDRCENPQNKAFSHYGGRGIAVCARWRSFKDFLTDAGSRPSPKHSIDRIDNDRGYEPGNVRWATQKEQTRNTRANKLLTFNGETLCMSEWAERTGIGSPTIRTRLVLGWSVADALTRPVTFMPRWHKEVAQ